MSHYIADSAAWQESWDRQQEAYLPDREHRLNAVLDAVDATAPDGTLRLLDLAGGTGTITLRALARFPAVEATVLDKDPVLLAIASASLRGRARVITADLDTAAWTDALPPGGYHAVLTATALHWLPEQRVRELYAEIREVLQPGGVFVNADHMPDDAWPALSKRLVARAEARRAARYAAGAVLSWQDWWAHVAADPVLAPLAEQRRSIYPTAGHTEWSPSSGWHVDALRAAGFAEAGLLWRGGADAAVIAVR